MPGELERAVKCRCNQICTLDDIAHTLQDVRKRKNIGKYCQFRSSSFKEKQLFRVDIKEEPKERVAGVTKKKSSCHNCGSTDHYANNCPKAKKKVYAIEKVPKEESPTEYSVSDSMGDAIREQSDDDQDPREEIVVEDKEETQIEIKDIQLEAGMPQDTENKNLLDRPYLNHQFPNWDKQLFPTKAKSFKSASGKMKSIGTIIKDIIIPHRRGNIRINPEFFVLEDSHIQGLLLGADYQRMYGIDIYNSKNRNITIGTNKEKKFSLDIYQISTHDSLEELLNEFREGQFSTALTRKIRGHDIELYLDVERPYPPMLRRTPYPASLETRKEIEKHINELLDMDVIRNIGHNEKVEITTSVLITWDGGKSRLFGDFRSLNNYTKAERYPILRIPHALDKLEKAKYITKMDCMKGFHQNGVKPNSMKLLIIICHMGIYEYTRIPFGIKNAPSHFQRIMNTILQDEILEVWMVVYIDDIIVYSETWEDHLQ
ncbi:hypothetical protein O181_009627 [Austropuccinia psidii MF-1]|uniref:CCHC-type domain-containing protein n=1 Tax=Austropuccinia psidii MF-1 TaxID=1389203 RepID=A0A9Q3BR38_9BASI|nr:hypothetical protein [Austropuccinia psidii MF-1]